MLSLQSLSGVTSEDYGNVVDFFVCFSFSLSLWTHKMILGEIQINDADVMSDGVDTERAVRL